MFCQGSFALLQCFNLNEPGKEVNCDRELVALLPPLPLHLANTCNPIQALLRIYEYFFFVMHISSTYPGQYVEGVFRHFVINLSENKLTKLGRCDR